MIAKRSSPAALRNRGPIADVLCRELPGSGTVLMIAEGSGEHAVHFARQFPDLDWLPSDPDAEARTSIAAHREESGLPNLHAPVALDVRAEDWPVEVCAAITCINMIHISPWAATLGLLDGAGRLLPSGGLLYLYGPYIRDGHPLEPSNAAFDESLRTRDPQWGLRKLSALEAEAHARDLHVRDIVEMPANNLSVILRKG